MNRFRILLYLFACVALDGASRAAADQTASGPGSSAPIILAGTVLTPDGPLDGFVLIEQGRIREVSRVRPKRPGAVLVSSDGIIAPGFVDLHNHVSYDVLPRWNPSALFADSYDWRVDPDFQRAVVAPYTQVSASQFCAMNQWGELRALVGGTTAIAATAASPCVHGIVRNIDVDSGLHPPPDHERVLNVLAAPPATDPAARLAFAAQAQVLLASPAFDALMLHVAEGVSARAHEEFEFLRDQGLLTSKGVVIHGTALRAGDFALMAATGTALVWSPRSNVELYGQTTDVAAARAAGVEIALAPDWSPTGSASLLAELSYAAQWNEEQLSGLFSDRELVEMATAVPAHIAGIDHEVGAVAAALRADLVVLARGRGRGGDPYRAVTHASARDVQLVMIDGMPLYGARGVLGRCYGDGALETIGDERGGKLLATRAAGVIASELAAKLQPALEAAGTSLAPLIDDDERGNPCGAQ